MAPSNPTTKASPASPFPCFPVSVRPGSSLRSSDLVLGLEHSSRLHTANRYLHLLCLVLLKPCTLFVCIVAQRVRRHHPLPHPVAETFLPFRIAILCQIYRHPESVLLSRPRRVSSHGFLVRLLDWRPVIPTATPRSAAQRNRCTYSAEHSWPARQITLVHGRRHRHDNRQLEAKAAPASSPRLAPRAANSTGSALSPTRHCLLDVSGVIRRYSA